MRNLLVAAALCAAVPPVLAAQTDPRLVAAVRLAQEGQGDSARAQVKRIIDATPAANPLYAEALFAAGMVAATAVERERQFQRLVVEFNGSAWSDDALLQLMQMNFARGDLSGVVRTAERLASDYPQSEVIPDAALWAARAYFRQDSTAAGCRWLTNGLARADTLNVELRNGLVFLNGRCGAAQAPPQQTPAQQTAAQAPPQQQAAQALPQQQAAQALPQQQAPTDTSHPAPPAVTLPVATPPVTPASNRLSVWSVQVASSANQNNADALVNRLAREGFGGGYVVHDGNSFKVRVSKLAQRADADALLARIRVKHPQAFVVEDRP